MTFRVSKQQLRTHNRNGLLSTRCPKTKKSLLASRTSWIAAPSKVSTTGPVVGATRVKSVVFTARIALAAWVARSSVSMRSAGGKSIRLFLFRSSALPLRDSTAWKGVGAKQKKRPPTSLYDGERARALGWMRKKLSQPCIFVKLINTTRLCPCDRWAGDGCPGKALSPALSFRLFYTVVRDVSIFPLHAKTIKKRTHIPTEVVHVRMRLQ